MIYFAYCTLLDVDEMSKYIPTAIPKGAGWVSGWQVCFSSYGPDPTKGGCDLKKVEGDDLLGLLYEMTAEEFDTFDKIAGVDLGYYRRLEVLVVTADGSEVAAWTYVVPEVGGPFSPAAEYTRPILVGARALKLPADYISKLEDIIASAKAFEE